MPKLFRALVFSSLFLAVPAFAVVEQKATEEDEKPKLRCKKFLETGSLVKKRKVCLTPKEWAEVNTNAQDRGREMQTLVSTERGN